MFRAWLVSLFSWQTLKRVLSNAEVSAKVFDGDRLHVQVTWRGRVVFERTIDFIPGA